MEILIPIKQVVNKRVPIPIGLNMEAELTKYMKSVPVI